MVVQYFLKLPNSKINSKKVVVRWADSTESSVSFNLLESMAKTSNPNAQALNNEMCWNYPSEIKSFPKMTFDDFIQLWTILNDFQMILNDF